jgi:hypothetical protein
MVAGQFMTRWRLQLNGGQEEIEGDSIQLCIQTGTFAASLLSAALCDSSP